jgi:hypothetical protein
MAITAVPANISEEYYQISEAILDSFPKYRLPLDLFRFKEDIAQLVLFYQKGARLSNEQVDQVHDLCAEGDLFVSRADHPIYAQHIAKQLDLVLLDKNLKEAEIADICLRALTTRLGDFFEQPVKPQFECLYNDVQVLTEYLWDDMHRLRLFLRRLHRGTHSLPQHSLNCLGVGLFLLTSPSSDQLKRKDFDHAALALLLHDVGMAKIPQFITGKTTPLKPEEREKIPPHTLVGDKIMHKLEQTFPAMHEAIMEHHERLDGSGYPQHSKNISEFGRLVAVADAFSAMIQTRPYAEAKEPVAAARELADARTRFDFSFSGKLLTALVSSAFGKL